MLSLLRLLVFNLVATYGEWRTRRRYETMSDGWKPERRTYRDEA